MTLAHRYRLVGFHNLRAVEKCLRAGNQLGKSHAGAAQMAMDSCCIYPHWHHGHKFDKPVAIERPFEFLGWAACTTSAATRDGVQSKLLGDIRQSDGLGTGLIPSTTSWVDPRWRAELATLWT